MPVNCDSGLLLSQCPDSHPVCCWQGVSQVWASCCKAGSVCRLDEGVCITFLNNTNNHSSAHYDNGSSYQGIPVSAGLDLSISVAAVVVACLAVGLIIMIAGAIASGMYMSLRVDLWLIRRQQQQQRDADAANSDDGSDNSSTKSGAGDDELPDGAECILCLSEKKGVVFLPCGHCCCCKDCSKRVTTCCLCRKVIKNKVKISSKSAAAANVKYQSPTIAAAAKED